MLYKNERILEKQKTFCKGNKSYHVDLKVKKFHTFNQFELTEKHHYKLIFISIKKVIYKNK